MPQIKASDELPPQVTQQQPYGTFIPETPTFSDRSTILNKFVTAWNEHSSKCALLLLALVSWGIAYALFGDELVGLNSQLFSLAILFISAKVVGCLVTLIKMPPMVGMLVMGILLRNLGFLEITGNYRKFTSVLRQLAVVNIMLPAGLGLDPKALKKMIFMILNLAIIPVAVEVIAITILSNFLLDLPWLWGILLGSKFVMRRSDVNMVYWVGKLPWCHRSRSRMPGVLYFCHSPAFENGWLKLYSYQAFRAAVSPAVIIPCLFELQDMGYGVNKGIHTLVIAASTFNDIICIAVFGIFIGIIFSTGSLRMQVLTGPIVLAIGFGFGIFWGFVCRLVPHKSEPYLVTLRTLILGLGCVLSAVGSDAIGYGGAGALGCIVAAFVANLGWRKDGWDHFNPVRMNFVLLWKFFEPISFGLIGMEVDFAILEGYTVLWGTLTMVTALLLRIITSFISTYWSNLNLKENIFVAISWIPKATVQAALGPVALDIAIGNNDATLISHANTVIIVAVISIIITSPIGAILIMQLGPRFLHRTPPDGNKKNLNGITNPLEAEIQHSEISNL